MKFSFLAAKYCPMLWKDLIYLQNLRDQSNIPFRMRELLDTTIEKCILWKNSRDLKAIHDVNRLSSGCED